MWLAETLCLAARRGRRIGKLGRFLTVIVGARGRGYSFMQGTEAGWTEPQCERGGSAVADLALRLGWCRFWLRELTGRPGSVSRRSAGSLARSERQRKATLLFWEHRSCELQQMRDYFTMYFILKCCWESCAGIAWTTEDGV